MLKRLLVTFSIFISLLSYTAAEEGDWLPITRPEIITMLHGIIPGFNEADLIDFAEATRRERIRYRDDSEGLLRYDARVATSRAEWTDEEKVWIAAHPEIPFRLIMAGNKRKLFVIQVFAPVVNFDAHERKLTFDFLSALYEKFFPRWEGAAQWPEKSAAQAWEARTSPDSNDLVFNPETALVNVRVGNITSTTFGTPPDFVAYKITSRKKCVPMIERPDWMRRYIC